MINWSTDEKKFKKLHPKEYKLWRLTQLINYGLDGEKLDEEEVKKAWPKIKDHIHPENAGVIEFLLWNKLYSPQKNILFRDWYTNKIIKDCGDWDYEIKKVQDHYEIVDEYSAHRRVYKNFHDVAQQFAQIYRLKALARQQNRNRDW